MKHEWEEVERKTLAERARRRKRECVHCGAVQEMAWRSRSYQRQRPGGDYYPPVGRCSKGRREAYRKVMNQIAETMLEKQH